MRHRRESDRAMDMWAAWWLDVRERGWPSESLEARLMAHAGEMVRASTPPGPRIPNIDRARIGPKVHRLLLDMHTEGLGLEALVMMLYALSGPKDGRGQVAEALGVKVQQVKDALERGRNWMDGQLRLVPLELRRSAGQANSGECIDSARHSG